MAEQVDLSKFGLAGFRPRGTVIRKRLDGEKLLFLFGERHKIAPAIYENLLTTLDLYERGRLSCVGMETWWQPGDVPSDDVKELWEGTLATCEADVRTRIPTLMKQFRMPPAGGYYAALLLLLGLSVPCRSVDDEVLYKECYVRSLTTRQDRSGDIARFLQGALADGYPDAQYKDEDVYRMAEVQEDDEFAIADVNLGRDAKFLSNMLALWKEAGEDKPAILNAGVAHQYRIALTLERDHKDISYVLLEQPGKLA
jgi:hypothetical protein